jgi:hypothetical protein
MHRRGIATIALFQLLWVGAAQASPCEGIDRGEIENRNRKLASDIAAQLNVPGVDVLRSFKLDRWSIVYVDTHVSDQAFLFFKQDPVKSHYLILWSGVARRNEEPSIRKWALQNAPGIPKKLAACFAWYATEGRDL